MTFVATPAVQQAYGLYAVKIVNSAPVITLSASPTAVVTGAATTLSWTTANATACTASGGSWTGSPAIGSGSVSLAVTATTIYTLTCSGAGGSSKKSVTVTATAAPASSKGGGGKIDPGLLLVLSGVLLFGLHTRKSKGRPGRALEP